MPGLAQDNNMAPIRSADYAKRVEDSKVSLKSACTSKTAGERGEAADKLAADLKVAGVPCAMKELAVVDNLMKSLNVKGKKGASERQGALQAVTALCTVGPAVEPFLLPLIVPALDLMGDKSKPVVKAAGLAVDAIFKLANANATFKLLPQLLESVHSWQSNVKRLNLISTLCKDHPAQMARCLADALPSVAGDLHDLKKDVREAAQAALKDLCAVCTNEDVVPFLGIMASALEKHDEIPACVYKLASTTFVQTVESATLSVMCPILVRGFNDRSSKIKRACARIVENMSKLVEDPQDLAPFLPNLLPLIEKARDHVSDPEVRNVCAQACDTLIKKSDLSLAVGMTSNEVLPTVEAEVKAVLGAEPADSAKAYVEYVAVMAIALNDAKSFELADWTSNMLPYLTTFADEETSKKIVAAVHDKCQAAATFVEEEEEIDAEELCNSEFSLAYGNKVLLKKTNLRLHRGFKYGLIGKNDSGKTSLMRAIAEYRVDNFPPASELKSMFVETDIPADDADFTVVDYIYQHPSLKELELDREEVEKTLDGLGFTDDSPANKKSCVGTLSGGWRMKLALARAMLLKADILLLDEPTNHLDAYNVKWVEDWLTSLEGVTAVMVSHDSGLLDRVCNNILQIEDLKLHLHKGNLSAFVKKRPDCKSYFELKSEKFKFKFPNPGRLEGINSLGKKILSMNNITFTYPGAPKAQLNNVSVQVSLGSRVACVGVNGAGKSTMIKLLTGELEPDAGSGEVWKHPNCRVGYIAQHAFHHIEKHLEKTANEYICWRYRNGNDREELKKITNLVNEEDMEAMKKPVRVEWFDDASGEPTSALKVIEELTEGRRENKQAKDQEYEVVLKGSKVGGNIQFWCLRKNLIKGGWEKVVKDVDNRIATRAAMFANPLTQVNVKKHLADVGLEEEFSTHMQIGALSGGQKVKVVLAAALWNRPHILILDEPTNYLDRDSLGALAGAIREFEGGVVMITHNSQFCDDLCPVVWHLENHTLNVKGDATWMNQEKLEDEKQVLTAVDKFGNTIEIKKKLTAKEQKKRDKLRKKINKQRKKQGLDPLDTDDDDF